MQNIVLHILTVSIEKLDILKEYWLTIIGKDRAFHARMWPRTLKESMNRGCLGQVNEKNTRINPRMRK